MIKPKAFLDGFLKWVHELCSALTRFCRGPMIQTKSGHCVFWPLATSEGSGRSDMRLTDTNKMLNFQTQQTQLSKKHFYHWAEAHKEKHRVMRGANEPIDGSANEWAV